MTKNKSIGFFGGKFLPFHMGHVYLGLAASNKVDELYCVVSSSKNRDKELCRRDGIKYIPAEKRLAWIGESFKDISNMNIIHIEDEHWDDDYDWEEGAKEIKRAIGKPIDFVFSSEKGYTDIFNKHYPNAQHIIIDEGRETVPISATELRKNIYEHWDKLPKCVKSSFVKKVAIVGTESCGKSVLVEKLARFYNTESVSEVGREYCERYSNQLTPEMFNLIAMDHFLRQDQASRESNKLIFVDSDAVITQYYLDMYFNGKKSSLVEEIAKIQNYDLIIFLEPDVPWVADEFRFAGEENQRKRNNDLLKRMYTERGINFVSIGGDYDRRFNKSREVIDSLFKK